MYKNIIKIYDKMNEIIRIKNYSRKFYFNNDDEMNCIK